ncbi:MAG: pyridoxamine 5'-phosphate oxidase [Phycisphaerales bacterium]
MSSESTHEPGAVISLLTRLLACQDLPKELPSEPMALLSAWFEDARRSGRYDDFNAMSLATANARGMPSVRVVLCKGIELDPPALLFFTNYRSRKGEELIENPHAATVFYWPHAVRQARIEGRVERTSAAESDAYFKSRPLISRIGACVSHQSQTIDSREQLLADAMSIAKRVALGGTIERPDYWGGFRLRVAAVELWTGREGRLHDRARWERDIDAPSAQWSAVRLSP